MGRKIAPAIESFKGKAVQVEADRLPSYTPLKEAGVDVLWYSQLKGGFGTPDAGVLLYEDIHQASASEKVYHLDAAQKKGKDFGLPVVSADFVTDEYGNLTGLKKLQYRKDNFLLEYEMDTGGTETRARLARIKKVDASGMKDVVKGNPIWNMMYDQALGAVDWNDIIFSYVTGEVQVNGFNKGEAVSAKTVATKPLITTYRS